MLVCRCSSVSAEVASAAPASAFRRAAARSARAARAARRARGPAALAYRRPCCAALRGKCGAGLALGGRGRRPARAVLSEVAAAHVVRACRPARAAFAVVAYVAALSVEAGGGPPLVVVAALRPLVARLRPPVAAVSGKVSVSVARSAGAVEAVITAAALQKGILPPNVGCQHQDPACPVTLVTKHNQHHPSRYALSNSFGFGGHNAVIAFKRWEG